MCCRKTLAGIGLVAGVIGFVAFVGIAIGVWYVTAELNRRTEKVLSEASKALDRAKPVAQVVRESIDAAEKELKAAQRPAPTPASTPPNGGLTGMLVRSALNETPGRVQTATRAVDAMSDLLVVANVALDSVEEHQAKLSLNTEQFSTLRQKMTAASAALHSADAILGSPKSKPNETIAAEDSQMIEAALIQARDVVGEVQGRLLNIDSQIAMIRTELPTRLRIASWLIFALSVLGAVGQVALLKCSYRAWIRVER